MLSIAVPTELAKEVVRFVLPPCISHFIGAALDLGAKYGKAYMPLECVGFGRNSTYLKGGSVISREPGRGYFDKITMSYNNISQNKLTKQLGLPKTFRFFLEA